jgi:hypothetical protein
MLVLAGASAELKHAVAAEPKLAVAAELKHAVGQTQGEEERRQTKPAQVGKGHPEEARFHLSGAFPWS